MTTGGIILGAVLAFCALGMEIYVRRYVVRIQQDGDDLRIETLSTLGVTRRVAPVGGVGLSAHQKDFFLAPATPLVDNDYLFLRIPGLNHSLIVDTTRDRFDRSGLGSQQR